MNLFQKGIGGLPLSVWLVLAVNFASISHIDGISDEEKTAVEKGLETGKEILDVLADKKFTETLTKIGSSIGPFLGVLGPAVSILLAFLPTGDSAELAFMKEMMGKIDTRFNQMDQRFDDVVRRIDWNKVAVNFGQIEQRILAMKDEYAQLYTSLAPIVNKKTVFNMAYENDFQNSGLKLYQAIISTQGLFQENLGYSVMRYTENDRKQTQEFLLGVLQLLLNAVKIELGYYSVNNYTIIAEERSKLWETRIQQVKNNFGDVDTQVKNRYHDQSKKDIVKKAAENDNLSNRDFLNVVWPMLVNKYYWRDWHVVIYNAITGSGVHYVSQCGGHILFRQDGRNILVASKDKTSWKMNMDTARTRLANFRSDFEKLSIWDKVRNYGSAQQIWEKMDKSGACSFAVIKWGEGVWYMGTSRVVYDKIEPYVNLLMFG